MKSPPVSGSFGRQEKLLRINNNPAVAAENKSAFHVNGHLPINLLLSHACAIHKIRNRCLIWKKFGFSLLLSIAAQ